LPTELEWEYATRGGVLPKSYKYYGSDTIDGVAWYDGNADESHSIGTKQPNEF